MKKKKTRLHKVLLKIGIFEARIDLRELPASELLMPMPEIGGIGRFKFMRITPAGECLYDFVAIQKIGA